MALGDLSKWARAKSVGYLRGRGLCFGVQAELFPHQATAPNKFALYADIVSHPRVDICDGDVSVLADNVFDYVFVGKRLQEMKNHEETLRALVRKLKLNGHLIVLLKEDEIANPTSFRGWLGTFGSWILKDTYHSEDHFLMIFKKTQGAKGVVDNPYKPGKRACIVRYGAMGDMIMLTPLIRQLHEDGYQVTVNLTGYSADIIKYNPYVSNIILQEKDAIPNADLGQYWSEWASEYDKYINLSESIEGTLLKVEGRRDFYTSNAWRHDRCNRNYYDFTMQLGGYSECIGKRGELYFSASEEREARRFRDKYHNKFLVLWALNGSSHHKMYGLFQPVLGDFLDANPSVRCVTVGDANAANAEFDHPQLIRGAGQWTIRRSLALTKFVDLVIGPESVIINAAGCFDTPKITLLSHSTHENLCKHFVNDYCLAPNVALAPCYPCHQLHYSKESCPSVQILAENDEVLGAGPACAMGAIEGERLIARMTEVMKLHPEIKT